MRSKAGAFLELRVWERRQARFIHPRPGGGVGWGCATHWRTHPRGPPWRARSPPDTRSGRSSLALHSWKWPRGRDVCIRLEPHELRGTS